MVYKYVGRMQPASRREAEDMAQTTEVPYVFSISKKQDLLYRLYKKFPWLNEIFPSVPWLDVYRDLNFSMPSLCKQHA